MPRPAKVTIDNWFDLFADMPPDEQVIAMRVLEQTHRISKRMAQPIAKVTTEVSTDGPKTLVERVRHSPERAKEIISASDRADQRVINGHPDREKE